MSLADAFAPAEADYREKVLAETWGHLAPARNVEYVGRIVYGIGVFDSGYLNPTALVCDFRTRKGKTLDSSPWFYRALGEFLADISWKPGELRPKGKTFNAEGCLYEWTGTFRNYKFKGVVRKILDTNSPTLSA